MYCPVSQKHSHCLFGVEKNYRFIVRGQGQILKKYNSIALLYFSGTWTMFARRTEPVQWT